MSLYSKALRRLGPQRWFAGIARRLAPPLDRVLYRLSKGRISLAGAASSFPTLLLTTTGRRSGEPRTTPLFYVEDGDHLVVAATNWGQGHHPAWSFNLLADPAATVQIGAARRAYRARVASDEEIARAWPRFAELWPAYDTYRDRAAAAGRGDLRVFVLEPA